MTPIVKLLVLMGRRNLLAALIRSLFGAGEQGAIYDPSDLSSMSQTSTGTLGNVAVGDPVGYIADKSGRGKHATQATSASRPTLQINAAGKYVLRFDGFDDFLTSSAIDFSSTDEMTIFAGAYKASDAAQACVLAVGLNGGAAGNTEQGLLLAPGANGATTYYTRFVGSLTPTAATATGYAAPHTAVLAVQADISTDLQSLSVNDAAAVTGSGDIGTGAFGSGMILYIGRRGGTTLPFNGDVSSLAVRGAASSAALIAQGKTFTNSKTGAY